MLRLARCASSMSLARCASSTSGTAISIQKRYESGDSIQGSLPPKIIEDVLVILTDHTREIDQLKGATRCVVDSTSSVVGATSSILKSQESATNDIKRLEKDVKQLKREVLLCYSGILLTSTSLTISIFGVDNIFKFFS